MNYHHNTRFNSSCARKKTNTAGSPVLSRNNHQFHAARFAGGSQSFCCPSSLHVSPASSGRGSLSQKQPQLNLSLGFAPVHHRKKPSLPWALPAEKVALGLVVVFWSLPDAPLHILALARQIPALDGSPRTLHYWLTNKAQFSPLD